MSKRTKWLLAIGVIAALIIGWQAGAFAAAGISGNFESNDGNTTKQTVDDWDTNTPTVNKNDSPTGQTDESFVQGSKEDTPEPTVELGSIPNQKSDLTNFKLYQNKGTDGHDYLYMYWKRANNLGTANMDFEFNQKVCTANWQDPGVASTDADCANNGTLPKSAPEHAGKVQYITPLRTAGDLLFTFDFASGGNQVNLNLLTWVTSGSTSQCEASNALPCWGNRIPLNGSGNADGAVNTAGTDATNPLFQKEGEAALDLTDTVFKDKCLSIGSAFLKSRSSASFTAASKDFIPPSSANISNCGKVIIRKVTSPATDTTTTFDYTSDLDREGTANDDPTFHLKNGENVTYGDVQLNSAATQATYTVTEGTLPANWTLDNINCSASTGLANDSTGYQISGATVTFKIDSTQDILDCTYTNTKQLGAIKVTKTRKHAADGSGDHPQSGVSFTVNGVTKQTDSNGQACFDGLTFDSYNVVETVPSGYVSDAPNNTRSVTVDSTASCADTTYSGETVSFQNTPLTNITISVDSQVDGGTASTMDCGGGATGSTGPNGDGSKSRNDLPPGTYTCTVVVDP